MESVKERFYGIRNDDAETLLETIRSLINEMDSVGLEQKLVYAEAMSQGLPVIYSEGQGFDGQFENGEVGFSIDSHDPVSVADGIKKAVSDYSLISKCATEGCRKFNWSEIAREYDKVYKSL